MKRAALVLLSSVLLATVGLGVARAAGPKPVDQDNPWVRALADPRVEVAALHEDPYGSNALRVWGDDRYETAVAISQSAGWSSDDALIVFLATGQNFPDALAGSASTLGAGPVLLVQQNALPQVTANEIARLQPCFIIALGGPNAISDAVINQARQLSTATCEPPTA
jgi:putative cell wall-binding protein